MTDGFEYRARAGNLPLSIAAFAGLSLLAAVIWTVAPAYALILMVPALGIVLYQIVVSPVYGIRVSKDGWEVLADDTDHMIPASEIAHVRFSDKKDRPRCTIVLKDGTEVSLPDAALPADPMALIRQASANGLNIRQA
ncbi:hypothetical protein HKCCE2091_15135 [Rhodobacterales bacterium HKCCE2091]|nr:hypothetical protein [Rhodobacterales bacterium HKCCE2091]